MEDLIHILKGDEWTELDNYVTDQERVYHVLRWKNQFLRVLC